MEGRQSNGHVQVNMLMKGVRVIGGANWERGRRADGTEDRLASY